MLRPATSGAQPATAVAAGYYHSMFLKSDGSLWAMGLNGNGQLGDGTYATNAPSYGTNYPEPIVASNITAIVGGGYHSLILKNDGSLWAMGANANGQLGIGTFDDTNQPVLVTNNVTAVAAGLYHSLFLMSDGSLWAMGRDGDGQLGDGTNRITPPYGVNLPVQVVASNVTVIAAGVYHSLFVKSDGSLWAMGYNYYGQLGDGTYGSAPFDGTNQPVQIVTSNVTAIAAGVYHSLFVKSDGSLWAMGYNYYGQLGDGAYGTAPHYGTNQPEQIVTSNVTAIAAGGYHRLFLQNDGSLWAMGQNWNGQLGDGTNGYPIQTSSPEEIVTSGVTAIAAGQIHSLFLKSDGSLWGMGDNQKGQLGDQSYSLVNQPKQILAAYNLLNGQLLNEGMRLAFVGVAGANYVLDRTFSLSPTDWLPQETNSADSIGVLVFTNTPNLDTNNFWRIHSVP